MCRTCSCLGVVATKFGPYFRSPGTPHLVATLPIVRVRAKRGHRGVQAFYCGGLVPDALRLRWGNNLFSSFNTQSNAAIGAQVGDWQCERVGRSGWAERIHEYSQCDRWRIKAGGQSCAGAAEVLLVIRHARLRRPPRRRCISLRRKRTVPHSNSRLQLGEGRRQWRQCYPEFQRSR